MQFGFRIPLIIKSCWSIFSGNMTFPKLNLLTLVNYLSLLVLTPPGWVAHKEELLSVVPLSAPHPEDTCPSPAPCIYFPALLLLHPLATALWSLGSCNWSHLGAELLYSLLCSWLVNYRLTMYPWSLWTLYSVAFLCTLVYYSPTNVHKLANICTKWHTFSDLTFYLAII